ncbi:MAG: SGNH/GDSL hydrolase family protein [Deltaproteobacteria bacterium]|nr:SGNH/GDSL hydrolase family protein [Deltaproteobacteria bacterium]
MSLTGNLACLSAAVAASLEGAARIYYGRRFRMPWRSRRIGEYPYHRFIEKAPPPLFFRFRKGFRSPQVNINRFGTRGPEPGPDRLKDRILLIGESVFFGAKLPREKDLWSRRLEARLRGAGYTGWEVLNAGVPGYNAVQYRTWWEGELKATRPKILLLEMGANDMTQAYVMGSRWKPGAPWPWEFIMRQERKSPWWNTFAAHSCAYFLWRRQKITERRGFESQDGLFQYEECLRVVKENGRAILDQARSMGIRVALISITSAYDPESLEKPAPQLDAIQGNWRENMSTSGRWLIRMTEKWLHEFRTEVNCPGIDLMKAFWDHPDRYQLFLDVLHWNRKGHEFGAEVIFNEIEKLGWW